MRRMRFAAVLVIAFSIVGLVACGGGSSSTPTPPPVPTLTSMTVTAGGSSVTAGKTLQFTATGHYSDGSTKDLTSTATWSSSDTTVATINASGVATGVKAGSAMISATSGTVSGNMAVTVAAAAPVLNSIALTTTQTSVPLGGTQQVVATGTYSDGSTANISSSATWSSSNTSVISVNSSGLATAMAATGSADITASSNGVTSPTLTLSAAAAAQNSIMIMPSAITLAKFQWVKPYVYAVYTDNSVQDVTGQSALSLDTNGMNFVNLTSARAGILAGKAAGTATLTASYSTFTQTASVTVSGNLSAIAVAPKTATIHQGGEQLFTMSGTFDSGGSLSPMKFVTWNADATTVAAFGGPNSDTANGMGAGSTTIRGNLSGLEDTATLTVDGFTLQSFTITPASPINMARNVTVQLTATGNFQNASNAADTQVLQSVTWASSDETVATVDNTGRVFSKHVSTPGSATITATLPNGMSQTATVNVAPGTLDHVVITTDKQSPKAGDVVHFTAVAVLTDGRQFDVTPIALWQSSDFNLALIDATGTFTALKAGKVTITTFFAGPVTTAVTITP